MINKVILFYQISFPPFNIINVTGLTCVKTTKQIYSFRPQQNNPNSSGRKRPFHHIVTPYGSQKRDLFLQWELK